MANLVLKTNTAGNDVSLEMLRGDSYCDWRIINTGGNLCMQANWTTKKVDYYNALKLDYNTGNLWVKGRISAPSLTLSSTTNSVQTAASNPALRIGADDAATHIIIDRNSINAKATSTTVGTLSINESGGLVQIGAGGLSVSGALAVGSTITADDKITAPSFIGRLGRVRSYSAAADVDAALSSCGAQLEFSTTSAAGTTLNNDGILLTLGYSTTWGAQIFVDDGSSQPPTMALRSRTSTSAWGDWFKIITSGGGTIDSGSLTITTGSKLVLPVRAASYTSSTAGEIWIVA